jgi:transglutaminase-like putative cysteine protease
LQNSVKNSNSSAFADRDRAWLTGALWRLHPAISNDPDIDPARPPAAALAELCQEQVGNSADLAHLLIAIVRGWAIPARFVSGYLDPGYFEPDDDDPEGTPARAQALHHWVEVLLPGGGWRGIDPAQGLFADDTYVRLAVGRDLQDVTGFRHSFKGDGEFIGIETSLNVQRLD